MDAEQALSKKRIQQLLRQEENIDVNLGRFGLGNQRTIEQYVRWSHTNLGGRWGKFLQDEHIDALVGLPDAQSGQPLSPPFCKDLKRLPVRDSAALRTAASTDVQ